MRPAENALRPPRSPGVRARFEPGRKLRFLFTGQGSLVRAWSANCSIHSPWFRDALVRCDAILRYHLDRRFWLVLYPAPQIAERSDAYNRAPAFRDRVRSADLWPPGAFSAAVLGHDRRVCRVVHRGSLRLEESLVLITRGARPACAGAPAKASMAASMRPEAEDRRGALAAVSRPPLHRDRQ